jgi:hypothetical protein
MYKLSLIIIVLILILLGYIYFTNPDSVVINERGKVEGLLNDMRSLIQGDKFWENQLKLANERYRKSLDPQLPSSFEMQKLYQKLTEDEKALNEKMKSLYTPEERMANSYRMKADSLDRAGKWRLIDEAAIEATTKESEKFRIIIPIIESKLKSTIETAPKIQDPGLKDKPAL